MAGALSGKNILVVEDEYFIAADLANALAKQGATVLGPARDLQSGIALTEQQTVHAAILDVNLKGGRSFVLADRLTQAEVPHMFVTGYDGWSLPDEYRGTPRIAKPFATGEVLAMIETLCSKVPA